MKAFGIFSLIVTIAILCFAGSWIYRSLVAMQAEMQFDRQIREVSSYSSNY